MNRALVDRLTFTQNNLQDYLDCKRRFQLRHIEKMAWPAVQSDPILENERLMRLGSLYHKMIQQFLIGISEEQVSAQIHDPDLSRWWDNFRQAFINDDKISADWSKSKLYPEVMLTGDISGTKLVAKVDLIVVHPEGKIAIYDWKTSQKRPSPQSIKGRMQTRFYAYLLAYSGSHLNGDVPISPDMIEMIYWFANFPDQPERILYSSKQFKSDRKFLTELINQIKALSSEDFTLTPDIKHCQYCIYRSFCNRGVEAGLQEDLEAEIEIDFQNEGVFDFEQVSELPF